MPNLKEVVLRVWNERKELNKKIEALDDFLNNLTPVVAKINEDHIDLLMEQLKYMTQYRNVLNRRLELFSERDCITISSDPNDPDPVKVVNNPSN